MDRKTRDIFLNNGVKAGVPQKCILMRKLVKILRQEGKLVLRKKWEVCIQVKYDAVFVTHLRCM